MASAVNEYDVVVPANTPKGSFASSLDFEPGTVVSIDVRIPKGHAGKTGIQIWYGGAQIIPRQPDIWYRGNGIHKTWEMTDPFPGGLGWLAEVYNLGKRAHTFYVTVETDPLGLSALFPPVLLLRQTGETLPLGGSGVVDDTVYVPGTPSTYP